MKKIKEMPEKWFGGISMFILLLSNFTGSYLSLIYEMETKTNSFLEEKICKKNIPYN